MKKKILLLLSLLMCSSFLGCTNSKNPEKIEEKFKENGYEVKVNEDKSILLIVTEDNSLVGWIVEYPDKIGYMNSEVGNVSIIIDPATGEYSNITALSNGEERELINEYLKKGSVNKTKTELLEANNNELEKMKLSVNDILILANSKLENEFEKEKYTNTVNEIESETKKYYDIATNLTEDKLTVKNDNEYYYDVFKIRDESNGDLSKYGEFESYELYFSVANYLEGFDMGFNDGSKYSKQVVGVETNTRDEFQPHYDNLSQFVFAKGSGKDPVTAIMNKLQANSYVSGSFDYDTETFDFTIADCKKCAAEMGISEEMLGFVLGFMDVYGSEISFDGNECTFKVEVYRENKSI